MSSVIADGGLAARAMWSRGRGWAGRALGVLGVFLVVGLIGVPSAMAAGGLRTITVDASKATGFIRSLQGVSGTPLPGDSSHPDLTSQFKQLGVNIVRTHDVDCNGTSDIDGLGPNRIFPNWNADPNDPSSYNFGPTDQAILSIVRSGAQVEYSVGHSDLTCAGVGFNNTPPPDPALSALAAFRPPPDLRGLDGGRCHLALATGTLNGSPISISGTRACVHASYGQR